MRKQLTVSFPSVREVHANNDAFITSYLERHGGTEEVLMKKALAIFAIIYDAKRDGADLVIVNEEKETWTEIIWA